MATLRKSRHLDSNFELQITPLIDTLVIILIFMLKSVATDSLEIDQSKGITIPSVLNGMSTAKGSRLDISDHAVSWNGQEFVKMQAFDFSNPVNGKDGVSALNAAIAATAEAEKNDKSFDGKLFLQADKSAPFPVLQEVLKIAKAHGYKDIRFVGAKIN